MSPCERHKDHPENAEMPPDMLLDHFLMCLGYGQQAETLARVQSMATIGGQCLMADHQGIIQSQTAYTAKLLTGIRQLLKAPGDVEASEFRNRLQALIS